MDCICTWLQAAKIPAEKQALKFRTPAKFYYYGSVSFAVQPTVIIFLFEQSGIDCYAVN